MCFIVDYKLPAHTLGSITVSAGSIPAQRLIIEPTHTSVPTKGKNYHDIDRNDIITSSR